MSPSAFHAAPQADDSLHRKTRWFVRLRWAAVIGQTVTILVGQRMVAPELALVPLSAILALEVLTNVGVTFALHRGHKFSERQLFGLVTLDLGFLTALLHFSGGPSNPFNFLYLVYVVLAAVLVRSRAAAVLTILSAALFGLLFVPALFGESIHSHEMMMWHLQGMWIAFVIAAVLIVVFMGRIDAEARVQQRALEEARERAERNAHLSSLATLVAGAAHELGTPLSTIAVVAKEVASRLEGIPNVPAGLREDATILRTEVGRCRAILERMAESSGNAPGDVGVELSVEGFVSDALVELADRERIDLQYERNCGELSFVAPRAALGLALRAVVQNALDASTASERPVLRVEVSNGNLRFRVDDDGPGIPDEDLKRVVEPFYTTKPPGSGIGLGLFLADNVMRELGGRLVLGRGPSGRGTRAQLELPLRSESGAVRGSFG